MGGESKAAGSQTERPKGERERGHRSIRVWFIGGEAGCRPS